MSQLPEDTLSNADRLLIAANQLGSVLAVYKLRPSYIRFLRRVIQLIIIISVFILIMSSIWATHGFQEFQFGVLFSSFLAGLFGLCGGTIVLRSVVSREQQEHVIICERGLLQVNGGGNAEIVHWKEIQAIEKSSFNRGISIVYTVSVLPGIKILQISNFYQDIDEMISLINQRSEKV